MSKPVQNIWGTIISNPTPNNTCDLSWLFLCMVPHGVLPTSYTSANVTILFWMGYNTPKSLTSNTKIKLSYLTIINTPPTDKAFLLTVYCNYMEQANRIPVSCY